MKILSGRYECGTEEQKESFRAIFGEKDTQYRFDLYFHWYNILHELGHHVLEFQGICPSGVDAEMLVNAFAVAYWNQAGERDRIAEVERLLEERLALMPAFVPADTGLAEYYKSIWGEDLMNDAMRYGHFQFSSVLEAIKADRDLNTVLSSMNFSLCGNAAVTGYHGEICAENAREVLRCAVEDLQKLGVSLPEVQLELVDDPAVQCAT